MSISMPVAMRFQPGKKMPKSPTKAVKKPIRTSPRKKTWASPVKGATKFPSIFDESEFSPLNNSWAETVEKDTKLTERLIASCKADRSRKSANPKKSETQPKFVKSLELTEALFTAGKRSERLRLREEKMTVIHSEPISSSTPKNKKQEFTRKRHLSNASTIPDEIEGCSPTKRQAVYRTPNSSGRPARKQLKDECTPRSSPRIRLFDTSSAASSPGNKSMADPKLGWCTDQKTIDRRTKDIEKAKAKPIYAKYLALIPKEQRSRDIHPRTPNKLINYSRRSFDQLMRIWKRNLYAVCGEEPSESVAGSDRECESPFDAAAENIKIEENENVENEPTITKVDIVIRPEADAMASLLGKFDMDTRSGGDSTLKAPVTTEATGPVDFSALHN